MLLPPYTWEIRGHAQDETVGIQGLEPRTQLLAAVPLAPLKRNKGLSWSSRNCSLPKQMIPTNGALQKAQDHPDWLLQIEPPHTHCGQAERQDGPVEAYFLQEGTQNRAKKLSKGQEPQAKAKSWGQKIRSRNT